MRLPNKPFLQSGPRIRGVRAARGVRPRGPGSPAAPAHPGRRAGAAIFGGLRSFFALPNHPALA